MSVRLYVGNVNFKASEQDLRGLFAEAGQVVSAKLIIDKATGKLRGFGFVEMEGAGEASKAIELFNDRDFMGRKLVVNMARPKESASGAPSYARSARHQQAY